MTGKAANVLVVEDDLPTLQHERLILEDGGYTVTSAASGEEAIVMVADTTPDLVLLDIGLPGIDGFTTCKVLRKFSQVPIIMVTGSTSNADRAKGLATGADDYITKPFSGEDLVARSSALLRQSTANKVLQRLNSLCRKFFWWVSSLNYGSSIGRFSQHGVQLYRRLQIYLGRGQRNASSGPVGSPAGLKALVKASVTGTVKAPQWAALGRRTKHLFLVACRAAYIIAVSLASLAREIGILAWDSRLASRVRAARLTVKLGEATVQSLKSRYVQKAQWGLLAVWKAVSDYITAFLSSFGKGRERWADSPVVLSDENEASSLDRHQSVPLSASPGPVDVPLLGAAAPTGQRVFLEELLKAYIKVAETICDDPMVSAPVVPLMSVYEQLASSSHRPEYSQQKFVQEVYLTHRSGIDTTLTGARVQFPISRGVPNKTLVVTDETGQEVRYYGIRFIQNGRIDSEELVERRPFNGSEVARYREEIQEAFRRQLEWPSEEFAQFVASQIHLAALSRKESRLFAQITRDSLQELVKELHQLQVKGHNLA